MSFNNSAFHRPMKRKWTPKERLRNAQRAYDARGLVAKVTLEPFPWDEDAEERENQDEPG